MQAATEASDGPDTEAAEQHQWCVELAIGAAAIFTWTGYAANSVDATNNAKAEFSDSSIFSTEQIEALTKVRSCAQVGI